MISYNAVEAALPYYTHEGVSYVWTSLALSMVYLFITLSNPLAGYLTGVFSLRKLMIIGSLGYAFFIARASVLVFSAKFWLVGGVILGVRALFMVLP